MKIIETEQEIRFIRRKPVFLILMASLILCLASVGLWHLFSGVSRLECEKMSGQCQFTREKLFTRQQQSFLVQAYAQSGIDYNDDDASLLWLQLKGQSEYLYLDGQGFDSNEDKDEDALEEIQAFFSGKDTHLKIVYDDRVGGMIYGLPGLVFAFFLVLFALGSYSWTLDKKRRRFTIKHTGVFGTALFGRNEEYPFASFQKCEIQKDIEDPEHDFVLYLEFKRSGKITNEYISAWVFKKSLEQAEKVQALMLLSLEQAQVKIQTPQLRRIRLLDREWQHEEDFQIDLNELPPRGVVKYQQGDYLLELDPVQLRAHQGVFEIKIQAQHRLQ